MSVVFTYDGGEGWIHLLDMLSKIEKHCLKGNPNPPADCLQWKREQRRRNLRLSEMIYGRGQASNAEEFQYHRRLRRALGPAEPPGDTSYAESSPRHSTETEADEKGWKETETETEMDDPGFRFYFHGIIQELLQQSKVKRRI
jgi:hypothetical protein